MFLRPKDHAPRVPAQPRGEVTRISDELVHLRLDNGQEFCFAPHDFESAWVSEEEILTKSLTFRHHNPCPTQEPRSWIRPGAQAKSDATGMVIILEVNELVHFCQVGVPGPTQSLHMSRVETDFTHVPYEIPWWLQPGYKVARAGERGSNEYPHVVIGVDPIEGTVTIPSVWDRTGCYSIEVAKRFWRPATGLSEQHSSQQSSLFVSKTVPSSRILTNLFVRDKFIRKSVFWVGDIDYEYNSVRLLEVIRTQTPVLLGSSSCYHNVSPDYLWNHFEVLDSDWIIESEYLCDRCGRTGSKDSTNASSGVRLYKCKAQHWWAYSANGDPISLSRFCRNIDI